MGRRYYNPTLATFKGSSLDYNDAYEACAEALLATDQVAPPHVDYCTPAVRLTAVIITVPPPFPHLSPTASRPSQLQQAKRRVQDADHLLSAEFSWISQLIHTPECLEAVQQAITA